MLSRFDDPKQQIVTTMGIPTNDGAGIGEFNHIYGYAHQNPLVYTDPFGLFGRGSGQMGRRLPSQTGDKSYTFEKCQFDMTMLGILATGGSVGLISAGYSAAAAAVTTGSGAGFSIINSAYCSRFPKEPKKSCDE